MKKIFNSLQERARSMRANDFAYAFSRSEDGQLRSYSEFLDAVSWRVARPKTSGLKKACAEYFAENPKCGEIFEKWLAECQRLQSQLSTPRKKIQQKLLQIIVTTMIATDRERVLRDRLRRSNVQQWGGTDMLEHIGALANVNFVLYQHLVESVVDSAVDPSTNLTILPRLTILLNTTHTWFDVAQANYILDRASVGETIVLENPDTSYRLLWKLLVLYLQIFTMTKDHGNEPDVDLWSFKQAVLIRMSSICKKICSTKKAKDIAYELHDDRVAVITQHLVDTMSRNQPIVWEYYADIYGVFLHEIPGAVGLIKERLFFKSGLCEQLIQWCITDLALFQDFCKNMRLLEKWVMLIYFHNNNTEIVDENKYLEFMSLFDRLAEYDLEYTRGKSEYEQRLREDLCSLITPSVLNCMRFIQRHYHNDAERQVEMSKLLAKLQLFSPKSIYPGLKEAIMWSYVKMHSKTLHLGTQMLKVHDNNSHLFALWLSNPSAVTEFCRSIDISDDWLLDVFINTSSESRLFIEYFDVLLNLDLSFDKQTRLLQTLLSKKSIWHHYDGYGEAVIHAARNFMLKFPGHADDLRDLRGSPKNSNFFYALWSELQAWHYLSVTEIFKVLSGRGIEEWAVLLDKIDPVQDDIDPATLSKIIFVLGRVVESNKNIFIRPLISHGMNYKETVANRNEFNNMKLATAKRYLQEQQRSIPSFDQTILIIRKIILDRILNDNRQALESLLLAQPNNQRYKTEKDLILKLQAIIMDPAKYEDLVVHGKLEEFFPMSTMDANQQAWVRFNQLIESLSNNPLSKNIRELLCCAAACYEDHPNPDPGELGMADHIVQQLSILARGNNAEKEIEVAARFSCNDGTPSMLALMFEGHPSFKTAPEIEDEIKRYATVVIVNVIRTELERILQQTDSTAAKQQQMIEVCEACAALGDVGSYTPVMEFNCTRSEEPYDSSLVIKRMQVMKDGFPSVSKFQEAICERLQSQIPLNEYYLSYMQLLYMSIGEKDTRSAIFTELDAYLRKLEEQVPVDEDVQNLQRRLKGYKQMPQAELTRTFLINGIKQFPAAQILTDLESTEIFKKVAAVINQKNDAARAFGVQDLIALIQEQVAAHTVTADASPPPSPRRKPSI